MTAPTKLDRPRSRGEQTASNQAAPALRSSRSSPQFLIGPWFDLLFIANLYWPALMVVSLFGGESLHEGLLFWQVYFVTAPHRWITLFLVCCDRRRTAGRELIFLLLGGVIVVGCLLLRFGTDSLICLGVVDYLWNAWHFASQHHGIFRIYQRQQTVPLSRTLARIDKIAFRGFLLYVTARVAGIGWSTGTLATDWNLHAADFVAAVIPAWLFGSALARQRSEEKNRPALLYLFSVLSLFLAMLIAAHYEKRQLVLQLALASAIFHSVEYMAIVTWSSTTPSQRDRSDVMGRMARTWMSFLVFFVLFMGFTNSLIARGDEELWIFINLIVAFLHYAYDGMIWKKRSPRRQR